MKNISLISLIRFAFGFAALLPARAAVADDDNDIKVDVVVDVTAAGEKFARPTLAHPAYFYPYTSGYTLGGGVVGGQEPPPPTAGVQHLIAAALEEQGYRLATKQSPPSLVLMFWWGYKVPIMAGATVGGAATLGSTNGGGIGGASGESPGGPGGGPPGGDHATGINQAAQGGLLPFNVMVNDSEMEDLVFGSNNDRNTEQFIPSLRLEALNNAARVPRYYVTVSALDFAVATQKKEIVVLWTAHMSTDLYGHNLDQVLPSLIAAGAPMFGRDTKGAKWPLPIFPVVPMGHVEVGAPYVKNYPRTSAAPASAPNAVP